MDQDSDQCRRPGTPGDATSAVNNFLVAFLYSENKEMLFRKFQEKVKPLSCSHGRGQVVLSRPQILVDKLLSDSTTRFHHHDIPLIVRVFEQCEAVLVPNEDGSRPIAGSGVTVSTISTMFVLIMRKVADDFTPVDRMVEILKLADIDNDGCLTIGEIFNSLFMAESLAVRLHRAQAITTDTPEMVSILANKYATQLTSILVQAAHPDCDDFRRYLNEHSQFLIGIDQARLTLERNPYFLQSLPNPAGLDVDAFVPREVCEAAKSVTQRVVAHLDARDSAILRVAHYRTFLDLIRCTENDDEFDRAKFILRGLELLRLVPKGASDGTLVVADKHAACDVEFLRLCAIVKFSSGHYSGDVREHLHAKIPDTKSLSSEFCSVAGVARLEQIGRTGVVPANVHVPEVSFDMQPVKLHGLPPKTARTQTSTHISKSGLDTFRRSISSSSIILLNSQLSVCFDGRAGSEKASSKKSSVTYAPRTNKTSSSAHVFCIVCDGYHV